MGSGLTSPRLSEARSSDGPDRPYGPDEAHDLAVIEIPGDALVLLVGAAGSGKSTLAARLFPAAAILSSDALRAELSGDPSNQAASAQAFRILHARAAQHLAAGQLTVIDATNIAAAARRPLRRLAVSQGRPIVAIVLDLPAAVCLARNAGRIDRIVPEDVIQRQLANLRRALDQGQLAAEQPGRIVVLTSPAAVDATTVRLTEPAQAATLSSAASPRRGRRGHP
jgi:protein phosphatase